MTPEQESKVEFFINQCHNTDSKFYIKPYRKKHIMFLKYYQAPWGEEFISAQWIYPNGNTGIIPYTGKLLLSVFTEKELEDVKKDKQQVLF